MGLIFDSFWRAALYCLHPRVVLLSLLPLAIMVALSFAAGHWYWEPAVAAVSAWLESNALLALALGWLDSVGLGTLRSVIGPLVVLFMATPLIVVTALLLVGLMMTPSMVTLVAQRRFPTLERRQGASWVMGLFWSLLSTFMALLAMVASLPLWLIPPLIMVLPPLIWGWLTYRVFAYDVLADHASTEERKLLFQQHRNQFLVLGIITGYLGALPSVLWASGAMFIAMAPLLIPLAIWIYTLVFAFSALWFAHFGLGALVRLREADAKALAKAQDWAAHAGKTPPPVVDVPGQVGPPSGQAALPPVAPPPSLPSV